jgi:hypothetical protein
MSILPSWAVIILNWRRPQNIARLVEAASAGLPQATIFVLDQAEPHNQLAQRDDMPWDLFWYLRRRNVGPGIRFSLAAELPFDHYLAFDDDTFLSAEQTAAFASKLTEDPSRPHGISGMTVSAAPGNVRHLGLPISRKDIVVSTLNKTYAFTREHAIATLRLAEEVGYARWLDVTRTEDILLSCAGTNPAMIHDLGEIGYCPTSREEGIAISQTPGFWRERSDLLRRLEQRGKLYVDYSEAPRPADMANIRTHWMK